MPYCSGLFIGGESCVSEGKGIFAIHAAVFIIKIVLVAMHGHGKKWFIPTLRRHHDKITRSKKEENCSPWKVIRWRDSTSQTIWSAPPIIKSLIGASHSKKGSSKTFKLPYFETAPTQTKKNSTNSVFTLSLEMQRKTLSALTSSSLPPYLQQITMTCAPWEPIATAKILRCWQPRPKTSGKTKSNTGISSFQYSTLSFSFLSFETKINSACFFAPSHSLSLTKFPNSKTN